MWIGEFRAFRSKSFVWLRSVFGYRRGASLLKAMCAVACVLACGFLVSCGTSSDGSATEQMPVRSAEQLTDEEATMLDQVQDETFDRLESCLAGSDYSVLSSCASFGVRVEAKEKGQPSGVSYFGHTLDEFSSSFGHQRYVFGPGADDLPIVVEVGPGDPSFDQIIYDIAGNDEVVLVHAVVAGATDGAVVNTVFAVPVYGAESNEALIGAIDAVASGILNANMESSLKDASVVASNGSKCVGMTGVPSGGSTQAADTGSAAAHARVRE